MNAAQGRAYECRAMRVGGKASLGTLTLSAMTLVLTWAVPTEASAQQPASMTALVFDEVTVVDVERGKLVPGQRVIITDNHIQTVEGTGTVKLPRRALIVDARGKYLIPGLWDMHVHPYTMIDWFYRLFIANGITGIRDGYSSVSIETQVQWWHETLAGTRVGPPRQLLTGTFPSNLSYEKIATLKARGANFLKMYPWMSPR